MTTTYLPLDQKPVLGILGGGQLGRMTVEAAASMGVDCHVFAPPGDAPACRLATATTRAEYSDEAALADFATRVDAVTTEFENVPAQIMEHLARHLPVTPGAKALATAQHRIAEKTLARDCGMTTPDFTAISHADQLADAMMAMRDGGVLKTCRFGYDGKGQVRLNADAEMAAWKDGFAALNSDDCILEEKIDFVAEASFMIARGHDGSCCHYPPTINDHRDGILARSQAPADPALLPAERVAEGQAALGRIAAALDLSGLLAMECFISRDGRLIFNEIAPRPHNSFHWTMQGAATSQFHQLVRTSLGLPLGSTQTYGRWEMINLLGEDMAEVPRLLETAGWHLHLYGKAEARDGRKMGHASRYLGAG